MNRYHYYRRLPHMQGRGGPIFVTFTTLGRRVLEDKCRQLVLEHCRAGDPAQYRLIASVVMPDHVHMILIPKIVNGRYVPLQRILKSLKGASAHSINNERRETGPVWQEESFDRVLRNDDQLYKAVEYIAENPVAARMAKTPGEYQWLWINWVCADMSVRAPQNPAPTS